MCVCVCVCEISKRRCGRLECGGIRAGGEMYLPLPHMGRRCRDQRSADSDDDGDSGFVTLVDLNLFTTGGSATAICIAKAPLFSFLPVPGLFR